MERSDILELMAKLKPLGMRAAAACPRAAQCADPGDEVMATAIKRRDAPARIIGELLAAEIAEKQARSIKYQLTIAKLPLAKDLDGFTFAGTPINESLVRDPGLRRGRLWRPAPSSPSSATPCWSAEPAPANRISP